MIYETREQAEQAMIEARTREIEIRDNDIEYVDRHVVTVIEADGFQVVEIMTCEMCGEQFYVYNNDIYRTPKTLPCERCREQADAERKARGRKIDEQLAADLFET